MTVAGVASTLTGLSASIERTLGLRRSDLTCDALRSAISPANTLVSIDCTAMPRWTWMLDSEVTSVLGTNWMM